jgi:hypothetical protein
MGTGSCPSESDTCVTLGSALDSAQGDTFVTLGRYHSVHLRLNGLLEVQWHQRLHLRVGLLLARRSMSEYMHGKSSKHA